MKISEVAEMLNEEVKNGNGDKTFAIWSWFADGERIYVPHKPCNNIEGNSELWGDYKAPLIFDDCRAHRISTK